MHDRLVSRRIDALNQCFLVVSGTVTNKNITPGSNSIFSSCLMYYLIHYGNTPIQIY